MNADDSVFVKSKLPIVVISTNGQTIPDEPKIQAEMGIIFHEDGSENFLTDEFDHYHGYIGIERRGSSSAMFPKKQYAIETWDENGEDLETEIMLMPEEEDWILHAPYSDKTLMRNVLAYDLARDLGWYSSRVLYCEAVLNGVYQGVYIWMEKIKRDKNRVDVSKLTEDENSGMDLTGGYIIKVDKFEGSNTQGFYSNYGSDSGDSKKVYYQYHYPAEDDITEEQKAYIQNYIHTLEDLIMADDYRNNSYKDYLYLESFADYFIINEITKNVDGYRLSAYFYKNKDDKDPRLAAGPVWDYNLAFGNADYYEGYTREGWQWQYFRDVNYFHMADPFHPPCYWFRLLNDPVFIQMVKDRWTELRQTLLHDDYFHNKIDSIRSHLGEAVDRNYKKWPVLGMYVWPNYYIGATYDDEIYFLKEWIDDRMEWLDSAFESLTPDTFIKTSHWNSQENFITVYPNPNRGSFTVRLSSPLPVNSKIDIFDLLGRKVYSLQNHDRFYEQKFQPAGLKSGAYFISINGFIKSSFTVIK